MAQTHAMRRRAGGLSSHKFMAFVIPEGSDTLSRVPSSTWPIQRETKAGHPLGTKNAPNRVPWLGLNTYLLLKLGFSDLEF